MPRGTMFGALRYDLNVRSVLLSLSVRTRDPATSVLERTDSSQVRAARYAEEIQDSRPVETRESY